jgi:hypothetical protein
MRDRRRTHNAQPSPIGIKPTITKKEAAIYAWRHGGEWNGSRRVLSELYRGDLSGASRNDGSETRLDRALRSACSASRQYRCSKAKYSHRISRSVSLAARLAMWTALARYSVPAPMGTNH